MISLSSLSVRKFIDRSSPVVSILHMLYSEDMDVEQSSDQEIVAAKNFVVENRIITSDTPYLACVDEGYSRDITRTAPIRLAGGDAGALGAIIATAQGTGITLPIADELLIQYMVAKKFVFPQVEKQTFSYHTDGKAKGKVDPNTHHVEDMHCGHLNGLTD